MNLDSGLISLTYGPVSEEYLTKVLKYCYTPGDYSWDKKDFEFFKRYPEFKECLE
jgi:hypothetical protein